MTRTYLIFLSVYVMLAVLAIDFVTHELTKIDLGDSVKGVIEYDTTR